MGWTDHLFNYNSSRGYWTPTPPNFTWQTGNLWADKEEAIRFVNDTGVPIQITAVSIKTVACDSGGRGYWAYGGYRGTPCRGYGATYECYIRVTNDNGRTYQESSRFRHDIPNLDGSNMASPGSGPRNTASFGTTPPFTGAKALSYKRYEFADCPKVEKGGFAYIHLHVYNFKGPSDYVTIKFVLNGDEVPIEVSQGLQPYIWQYNASEKAWHLKKPAMLMKDGKWDDVAGDRDK